MSKGLAHRRIGTEATAHAGCDGGSSGQIFASPRASKRLARPDRGVRGSEGDLLLNSICKRLAQRAAIGLTR
jgi:hypothetical protein